MTLTTLERLRAIRAGDDLPMDIITPDELPPVWREFYDYRAAIREFDGGQAREHAEAAAFTETIRAWRGSEADEPWHRPTDSGWRR